MHCENMPSLQTQGILKMLFMNYCIIYYLDFLKSYADTMNILRCAHDFLHNTMPDENVQEYETFWGKL